MADIELLLKECTFVKKPTNNEEDIVSKIIDDSDKFPISFPIDTARCKTLIKSKNKNVLEENIRSTYPLLHDKVLMLFCTFLIHKREHGSSKEKALYKEMTVTQLVDRMLKKRSVMFLGSRDRYMLASGHTGYSGWEAVGTDAEKEPLVLKDCLSYDEMQLSAMLYVSGHSVFINNGSRKNCGVPEKDANNIETNGVIIGLIGTRLNKHDVMEFQEIVISKTQNIHKNGYGGKHSSMLSCIKNTNDAGERTMWRNIWSKFYNEPSLTYDEAKKLEKGQNKTQDYYMKKLIYDCELYFNNTIFSKHLLIAFDCAMMEAHTRATQIGKFAYLHVVGIGLGVWKIFKAQDAVFVKTFLERLRELVPVLTGLSDVHLSYMQGVPPAILTSEGAFIACDSHPKGGIQVHLSNRDPSSKLTGPHQGKLIVVTYAWDGNAQPGNEYWKGSLKTSGDPAAACSSQVSELHNSLINTTYVCGDNLHVVGTHGVHHVSHYAQLIIDKESVKNVNPCPSESSGSQKKGKMM